MASVAGSGPSHIRLDFNDGLDEIVDFVSWLVANSLEYPEAAKENAESLTVINAKLKALNLQTSKHALILSIVVDSLRCVNIVADSFVKIADLVRIAVSFSTRKSMQSFGPMLEQDLVTYRGPAGVRDAIKANLAVFSDEKAVKLVQQDTFSFRALKAKLFEMRAALAGSKRKWNSFTESALVKILVWRAHILRIHQDRPDLLSPQMLADWVSLEAIYAEHISWLLVDFRHSLSLPFYPEPCNISSIEVLDKDLLAVADTRIRGGLGDASYADLMTFCCAAAGKWLPEVTPERPTTQMTQRVSKALDVSLIEWSRVNTPNPESLFVECFITYAVLYEKRLEQIRKTAV